MNEEEGRIIQIIPARGWRAIFVHDADEEGDPITYDYLIGWGLQANGNVIPLAWTSDCVDDPTFVSNCFGLCPPGHDLPPEAQGTTQDFRNLGETVGYAITTQRQYFTVMHQLTMMAKREESQRKREART